MVALEDTVTLDTEIVTRISDVLRRISDTDHREFSCCPKTDRRTAEYLTHFFTRHFDSASAPREFLTPKELVLKDAQADEYRDVKRRVREAGSEAFVQDDYWDTRMLFDFHDAQMNMVVLHDYSSTRAQAAQLRKHFQSNDQSRCAAELRFALNHGSDQLTAERPEFLRSVYAQEPALKFIGTHYTIDEAHKLYGQACPPHETLERLETSHGLDATIAFMREHHTIEEAWPIYEQAFNPLAAFVRAYAGFGKEAALGYLSSHYPSHEAGAMIREALPDDEVWAATEAAFKDRIIASPAQERDVPAAGSGAASVDARHAAYK